MNVKRQFARHSIFVCGLFAILTSTFAKPSFSLAPSSLPSFASITQEYVGRRHAAQMKNYRWVVYFVVFALFLKTFIYGIEVLKPIEFHFLFCFASPPFATLFSISIQFNSILLMLSSTQHFSIIHLKYKYIFVLFPFLIYAYLHCHLQWYPATEWFTDYDILSWSNHSHR